MHVINAVNVRDALLKAFIYVLNTGKEEPSRAGDVITAQEPITIHYAHPKEHVLLNPIRDANPFFHLMEAMWMLAGRDDSAFLDYYVKDFGKRFGENGIIMDAYGQRWRHGNKYDQLDEIISLLRREPTSRQAVLQMWGAGRDDLRAYSSKPCNLIATFRIQDSALNMTVFNRSNDLILGCCGANAVHFPILQEYIAGRIGVEMGEYWQVTTNLHVYKDQHELLCKRGGLLSQLEEEYGPTMPLIEYPQVFNQELEEVMYFIDNAQAGEFYTLDYKISNRFLSQVVVRMAMTHILYKNNKYDDAMDIIDTVAAHDWKQAGREWLVRRICQKVKKTTASDLTPG
jgi:thymidylate synthase